MKGTLKTKAKRFKWIWFFRMAAMLTVVTPIAYIAIWAPAIAMPLYNMALFQPWKYPVGLYDKPIACGIKPEDVYFKNASGNKLHAWLYKVPHAKKIFLVNHGNGGNLSIRMELAGKLLKTGNSVFVYDYQGYGRSDGTSTMATICDDGLAAYNYLTNDLHYDPNQIILFGESLGSVVAGDLAGHVKCAGVILECPLYSVLRRGNELIPMTRFYPDWMWPKGGLDNSKVFAKAHAPLLIISGTKDNVIPVGHADDLYAIACQPKSYVRIEGAGHTDLSSPLFDAGIGQFLKGI